ncbi:MAG: 2OG-Fe(II) oxygenase family protein [Proteobacteria bacterium]|nr:2OG-Fe(II) oxygenase family protein [Pseudomonadota bacterium]
MNAPMQQPQIVPLFPTPIVLFEVPDASRLNAELRKAIEERERSQPTAEKTNRGGWQSSWDMDRWGGPAAIQLLAYARNVANRLTTDTKGVAGQGPYPGYFAVTWIANMWANVNRSGDANDLHSHPGAFWSGVYYVDDGGIDADPTLGGELEFIDPRGPLPVMNAPHLRIAGTMTAGTTERFRPKVGRLVMFPSWVLHQVRPYRGTAERVSIALNLAA